MKASTLLKAIDKTIAQHPTTTLPLKYLRANIITELRREEKNEEEEMKALDTLINEIDPYGQG